MLVLVLVVGVGLSLVSCGGPEPGSGDPPQPPVQPAPEPSTPIPIPETSLEPPPSTFIAPETILASTVLYEIRDTVVECFPEEHPDYPTPVPPNPEPLIVSEIGLGTIIKDGDEVLTHNHHGLINLDEATDIVFWYDNGTTGVTYDWDKVKIRPKPEIDPGTSIIELPNKIGRPSAKLGNANEVKIGHVVQQAYYDGTFTPKVTQARVTNAFSNYQGEPTFKISPDAVVRNPSVNILGISQLNGFLQGEADLSTDRQKSMASHPLTKVRGVFPASPIIHGSSGGGTFLNGNLVANMWGDVGELQPDELSVAPLPEYITN